MNYINIGIKLEFKKSFTLVQNFKKKREKMYTKI